MVNDWLVRKVLPVPAVIRGFEASCGAAKLSSIWSSGTGTPLASVNERTPEFFAVSNKCMKRMFGFGSQFAMLLKVRVAPVIEAGLMLMLSMRHV